MFSLPIVVPNLETDNEHARNTTATDHLESEGFMIIKARTKFALLTNAKTNICSNSAIKYCNVQSPIYPVNLAQLCNINLFLQKQDAVKKNCVTIISLNTKLPSAIKSMKFLWEIVSQTSLRFSIVCNNDQTKTVVSKPPIFWRYQLLVWLHMITSH